jgi:hypothetical protein
VSACRRWHAVERRDVAEGVSELGGHAASTLELGTPVVLDQRRLRS